MLWRFELKKLLLIHKGLLILTVCLLLKLVFFCAFPEQKDSRITVSVPTQGFKRKYSPTATPTARIEKTNCRIDSPKNIASVKLRISLLIFTSK